MRATRLLVAVIAVVASGCDDREVTRVICHNANCVEPTDPELDDTLGAMQESLALRISGRPAIDALEVDSYWRGSDDTCLFAHDLVKPRTTTIDEMTTELATYITSGAELGRHAGPFRIYFELKQHVDPDEAVKHNDAQRIAHVDCAWRAYEMIANASMVSGREIEFVFSSFSPALLREIMVRKPPSTPIPFLLDTFYGIPKPLSGETQPLDDFAGIPLDIVEIHPHWIHDAQIEGLNSLGLEIVFWTFSATTETFNAIDQYEPDAVGTSEAQLMVRWLEN
jgi:hypothetical protein